MVGDYLVLLDVRDSQVNLVSPEILVLRVLLASAAHPAGRETPGPPASLVSVATLVLLVQMAHRVPLVLQDQSLQPMVSSSPDTVRRRKCPAVLREPT